MFSSYIRSNYLLFRIHAYPNGSLYNASKFAVNGFTQAIRHDLMATPVRVTEIRPGMVQTEFWNVRFGGDGSEEAVAKAQENVMPLQAGDIADQVFCKWMCKQHDKIL